MSKRSFDNKQDDDDDDDDYMSDKILTAASQVSAPQFLNPRRRVPPPPPPPPLISTKKARQIIEHEQREQGLATALSSDNKGFQLLKKMGYKEGSKLGVNSNHGLTEPIPIKIHSTRSGLGEEKEKQEQVQKKQEVKTKFNQQIQSTYQDNLKQKYYFKRLRGDIAKCQAVCERLDRERLNLEESNLWKKKIEAISEINDDDDDDEQINDQYSMENQLMKLTEYLRDKHLYCIWCGQAFESNVELEQTCPGNERDLH